MIKKIISTLMMLSLLLSLSATATTTFTDVNGSEWFYDDLMYLSSNGIINGKTDGSFSGNDLLTKDALIKTLVVSEGHNVGNASGYWAQNYIDKADSLGWLNATTSGNYTSAINRYESCLLIVNALASTVDYPNNLQDYSLYISDYNQIPSNYKNVVLKVYALGIITGYTDGSFKGTNTLTRAEMAAIISRFNNPNNRKIPLNPNTIANIESFSTMANTVMNPNTVKFEDNKLQYLDLETNTWKPIASTGLQPNVGRLVEDSYIASASYIHNNTDYSIVTSYSYSNFYMYINDHIDNSLYTLSVNDSSNTVIIDLTDLYNEPILELSSPIANVHVKILQVLAPDDYQDIYDYIHGYYEFNDTQTPIYHTQTFDTISVKTISQQGSFMIELTIN